MADRAELLTVEEVARRLKCSVSNAYRLRGPYRYRIGEVVRFNWEELLEFYREGMRIPQNLSRGIMPYKGKDWLNS